MISRIIEAVLFAADAPLTITQIALAAPDVPLEDVEATVEALRDQYESEGRGWKLDHLAGGWQLLSHPEMYSYVERFLEGKRRAKLSRAALESLAVIAYRQPITRGELEDLRGVDCGGVLHTLLERELVTISGRSPAIGRPLLYRTTEHFLEHFGLASLSDLPRLEEMETLWSSEDVRAQVESELERRLGVPSSATEEVPETEAGITAGRGGNGGGDGDRADRIGEGVVVDSSLGIGAIGGNGGGGSGGNGRSPGALEEVGSRNPGNPAAGG